MKTELRIFLINLLAMASHVMQANAQQKVALQTLWYNQPANSWLDALPLGNGSLGAMVFGDTQTERIQFNESSLVTGTTETVGNYQPFGDIFLKWNHQNVAQYRRELLMNDGMHRISYTSGGVKFEKTYFISYPDKAMICLITANKPKSINVEVALADVRKPSKTSVGGNLLAFSGLLPENKMQYEAQLQVTQKGGKTSSQGNNIKVANADTLMLVLVAGTNFKTKSAREFQGEAPHQQLVNTLAKVKPQPYIKLLQRHRKDFSTLFNRVAFSLGGTNPTNLPTDELLVDYKRWGNAKMEELLFHYGRYLLISSSRPGGLPANLQGIWNQDLKPAWYSQYTTNINLQMNYWPAELTNLTECHQPYFDWLENLARVNKTTTDTALKTDKGWLAYSTNNIMGGASKWRLHRPGSAWMSAHFWEHFSYTKDTAFLRNRAYPMLKELVSYWKGHLVKDANGKLITPDGWSPEHGPGKQENDKNPYPGTSYDQQIVYDLLSNYINAEQVLKIDQSATNEAIEMRDKLLGPQIGKWGQLQEWAKDLDDSTDHHRHSSHLFAVYPGGQIDRINTPDWAKAASRSLDARGNESTGWATAWRINLRARLGQGDNAHRLIKSLIRPAKTVEQVGEKSGLYNNLFDAHPPFQIDGNLGYAAGVAEMLLQSHNGTVSFLPALPTAWRSGEISGLKARGNLRVSLVWQNAILKSAIIEPKFSGAYLFRYGDKNVIHQLVANKTYRLDGKLKLSQL